VSWPWHKGRHTRPGVQPFRSKATPGRWTGKAGGACCGQMPVPRMGQPGQGRVPQGLQFFGAVSASASARATLSGGTSIGPLLPASCAGTTSMMPRTRARLIARANCWLSRSGRSEPGSGLPRRIRFVSSSPHHARTRAAKPVGVVSRRAAAPRTCCCNSRSCASAPRRPGLILGSFAMPFGDAITGRIGRKMLSASTARPRHRRVARR